MRTWLSSSRHRAGPAGDLGPCGRRRDGAACRRACPGSRPGAASGLGPCPGRDLALGLLRFHEGILPSERVVFVPNRQPEHLWLCVISVSIQSTRGSVRGLSLNFPSFCDGAEHSRFGNDETTLFERSSSVFKMSTVKDNKKVEIQVQRSCQRTAATHGTADRHLANIHKNSDGSN